MTNVAELESGRIAAASKAGQFNALANAVPAIQAWIKTNPTNDAGEGLAKKD